MSELNVRCEAVDDVLGEILRETEVVEAFKGTMQATVVGNGSGPIKVDVRMALQLVERETVDVQLARRGILND